MNGHRLSEIAAAVGGEASITLADEVITRLVIDSRKPVVPEGSLFIALQGTNHDGHGYIGDLKARGLRNVLVARGAMFDRSGLNVIEVADTLHALQQLAAWHRAPFTYPVIGITGSNGKTIVKEWLFQMLRDEERIVRSPGSWNSQVGVPLSVWDMGPEHTLGVFEAGISKSGEMPVLQSIIAPTIGLFTNLGPAHSEGFSSDAEKLHEKFALFTQAGVLVCCSDDPLVQAEIATGHQQRVLRDWSRKHEAFVRVLKEEAVGSGIRVRFLFGAREHELTVPFDDAASLENAMHCLTLLLHLGRDMSWIASRIAQLAPVEMRLRTMQGVHDITLIDDSYSNDLASLRIALDHQTRIAQGRERVVVLSDIVESGASGEELYGAVADLLRVAGITRVVGVGEGMATHQELFAGDGRYFKTAEDLLREVDPVLFAGAAVLVKGARAFQLERVVRRWQQQVHGTVLEVDLDAMRHNLNHYRAQLGPAVKLMAMVKAFGYGSGALELARLFMHERVHYLGVAYADEGIELRQNGITTPILVMNPEPVPMETLHRFGLEAVVYDLRSLHDAIDFARQAGVAPAIHIKLDTGMHRLGFVPADMDALLNALTTATALRVASVFSHLAASEDPQHDAFTRQQIETYRSCAQRIDDVLGYHPLWHIANSGGIGRFREAQFDMVRLGIGLHGIGANDVETALLRPTVSLRTVIAQVKDIPVGDTVGYGRRFTAERPTRIAILPIGYADGLSRRLGNGQGRVYIAGKPAPFVGSICMDMCMVDVTGQACKEGDDVVVFDAQHPLQDFARDLGTIPYEALTSISQRVKRVYAHA